MIRKPSRPQSLYQTGREFENVQYKDASIQEWCQKISQQTGQLWDYRRVSQVTFDAFSGHKFADLLKYLV